MIAMTVAVVSLLVALDSWYHTVRLRRRFDRLVRFEAWWRAEGGKS